MDVFVLDWFACHSWFVFAWSGVRSGLHAVALCCVGSLGCLCWCVCVGVFVLSVGSFWFAWFGLFV